ncbi:MULTISPECIES: putative leader peptide [unclassified Streptomyces]
MISDQFLTARLSIDLCRVTSCSC